MEFKGRDALREMARLSIAREVVAMLNAEGGEVWVGLAEEDGIAVRVEPIAQVDNEVRRLHDHLVDVVEPALVHGEVRVERAGKTLRITVKPDPKRRPYSLKGKGGAVYFPVRIEDRIRPMTREEQRAAFGQEETASELGDALRAMLENRVELQPRAGDRLSLRIRPVRKVPIAGRQDEIVEMLLNPERTGNRRSGWTFANLWVVPDKLANGGVRSSWPRAPLESDEWYRTEVGSNGAIVYEAGLDRFSYHRARGRPRPLDSSPELWPLALAELPVSVMRLAATIYAGSLSGDDQVLADLSLFGLGGWKLRPGSPGFVGSAPIWPVLDVVVVFEGRDLLLPEPLVFTWREVEENPDRCAYRLVRLVYREFGYGEEDMPRDLFDPRTGRLTLVS